ncbi:Carbon catabolite repressor protein [Nymphaea thermarum]|nr:Carbon catabolite repressor protein [Nymphaea thermarum]
MAKPVSGSAEAEVGQVDVRDPAPQQPGRHLARVLRHAVEGHRPSVFCLRGRNASLVNQPCPYPSLRCPPRAFGGPWSRRREGEPVGLLITSSEPLSVLTVQTYTIVQELEKLATTENIPSLLCGGFNFIPGRYFTCLEINFAYFTFIYSKVSTICIFPLWGKFNSAPHEYLTRNTDPVRRHFSEDPFIPPHIAKRGLTHQLPLVSAYSSFATMEGGGPYFEEQRRRMNLRRNEPRFTNRRANFSGTLDFLHR